MHTPFPIQMPHQPRVPVPETLGYLPGWLWHYWCCCPRSTAGMHRWTCGNIVLCAHLDFTSRISQEALVVLKSIVVIPVALWVLQSDCYGWLLCDRTQMSHFVPLLHRYRLIRANSRQPLIKPVQTEQHLSPERYTTQTKLSGMFSSWHRWDGYS